MKILLINKTNLNKHQMTSLTNNENDNVLMDKNKENDLQNMDEFINRQINKAKNYPKVYQKQTTKGLSVLDPNVPCERKQDKEGKDSKINVVPIQKNNVIPTELDVLPFSDDFQIQEGQNDDDIILTSPNLLDNEEQSEKEHKQLSTLISEAHKALDNLNISISQMYTKRESDNLLVNEGESSYKYNKLLEETVFNIPPTFLSKHKISPCIRTRMIDWMLEVLSIFESQDETFFLSVNILDLFLWKTPTVYKNDNMHLMGMAAMFIATKFQEIYPIVMKDFVHRIGHDQFKAQEIKKMECKILNDLNAENLVSTSIYDFCKTYFYDFYYNNKNLITTDEDNKIYHYIKQTSIYLNKLILHYEFFYQENCSMKAIACIVTAIKIVGDCLNGKLTSKHKGIYNDWMLFLIEQGGFDKTKVEVLAKRILAAFQLYQNSKSISRNLNKFCPLTFVNN